jgi:hypothetical protein
MLINMNLIYSPKLVSPGRVLFYRNRMKEPGYRLPPIYVKPRGTSGQFILTDGANRFAAAKHSGATEVEVQVV